jgi:hypothetical protein
MTTIRRLRVAELRLPMSIVPSDQALFVRLKASFANLREFDTSMIGNVHVHQLHHAESDV